MGGSEVDWTDLQERYGEDAWRTRWYIDVGVLQRHRILPERTSKPDEPANAYTCARLSEYLGRRVSSLSEMTLDDWRQACENIEAHFGLADGDLPMERRRMAR